MLLGLSAEGAFRTLVLCSSQEEVKLHTLANSSSPCSSSSGSVSSGITSGYNSSPALAGQLQSPESVVSRQRLAVSQGPGEVGQVS